MEVLASASEGVMGSLLEKLKALLAREYALQAGVHGDIRFLHDELQSMHASLRDLAMVETATAVVKEWGGQVQELVYDIEDAIDDFTHHVGSMPMGLLGRVKHFVSVLMARRRIAEQVRDLKARTLEVSQRRIRYDLPVPSNVASPTFQLPPTVYAEMAHLVGIDSRSDEIVGKLTDARTKDPSGRRRVASMVGFAGVGKTTLAMAVYRKLEDQFQCRAFVTVSRKFDIKRVLKDMLQQATSTSTSSTADPLMADMEAWEVGQLAYELGQKLQDKRYLIVIDDLWKISAWEDIICVLPENNRDSIIITTTRDESVADACCSSYRPGDLVHRVASLNAFESSKLFLGRIFGSADNCPHDLKEVSEKILKKCAGLPLAIVCISSLLAARPKQTTMWKKVHNSLGSVMESNDSLCRLKQALNLGYDYLPHHLQVCLLYLSAFPGDCKIERDRLTRRWIAEGFVTERPGTSMQEVAECYFNELIRRNMIQAVDVDCFGEIHAFRIHDVMFELVATKSIKENFVTLVGDHQSTPRPQHYVRRLSLDCYTTTDGLDLSIFNMSHARSLTIYGDIDNIHSIPECRFLRALDFECCVGVNSWHLRNIGDLFMLKYLSLKSTWISELPSQIGELKYLETLDLMQTNIRELPVEITRLQRLVYLLAGGAELPQGVGNMRSLQTLCIRATSKKAKNAVKELLRLTNLTKLEMSYMNQQRKRSHDEKLDSFISKLGNCKLESLHLNLLGYSIGLFLELQFSLLPPPVLLKRLRTRGDHGFLRVPMWIASLTRLTDLELTIPVADEGDLQILGELPGLIRFRLTLQEPSREGIVIQIPGFPCLKEFFIECRIMSMFFSQGVMPKLEKLELHFCVYQEDLRCIRFCIEHLQSLKEARFVIVLRRGVDDPDIEFVKEAIKNAIDIDPSTASFAIYMSE